MPAPVGAALSAPVPGEVLFPSTPKPPVDVDEGAEFVAVAPLPLLSAPVANSVADGTGGG